MGDMSVLKRIFMFVALGALAYIQNMAFTWSSRSRNSGDPSYHRYAAICSNGVWFIMTVTIWNELWKALTTPGHFWLILVTGLVYVAGTTEGSVHMMRIMLKKEKGNRVVGARA